MSRGARTAVSGNISNSMRSNYAELGVEEYYRKVGKTYRNPHMPGIQLCLFTWLNHWLAHAHCELDFEHPISVLDMACGHGEATICVKAWEMSLESATTNSAGTEPMPNHDRATSRRPLARLPPSLSHPPQFSLVATDPFTSAAFEERTSLPCSSLSFDDLANGIVPPLPPQLEGHIPLFEIIVCSFALHLLDSPSKLFALLWELSTKSKWLVVLAPHKRPEIKDGWGWVQWDIEKGEVCPQMSKGSGELVYERVHCRTYRSQAFM
ncbi:hypothetical protein SISNIDRAFT_457710 [Sistotremastrum niveocremeum HHB9708]|uniref:Methyltransferase domain-containing protein n=1 Tax=Sistotremastrum niveocremeum HHB9708 TaxID=1314777 RepID=A0A164RGU3_9AGAM|nr:hypothetical protein SISNIDRAFT_457710 [Sistotremastrum niveocremeum HHB9708]